MYIYETILQSGDTWQADIYACGYVEASGGNVNLTVNMDSPAPAELIFKQDTTGGRTLTINGQAVTVDTAASSITWVSLMKINGVLCIRGKATNTSSGGTTQLSAPTISATAVSSSQVDIVVGSVANASSYEVYESTDGTNWTLIGTTAGTYNRTALTASTLYYYRAKTVGNGTTYTSSEYATASATTQAEATTGYSALSIAYPRGAVNSGGNITSDGTYSDWQNTGVLNKYFPANQDGALRVKYDGTNGNAVLGINTTGKRQDNTTIEAGLRLSGGSLVIVTNGSEAATGVSLSSGEYAVLRRVSGVWKVYKASSAGVETFVQDAGLSSNALSYIVAAIYANTGNVIAPEAENATALPSVSGFTNVASFGTAPNLAYDAATGTWTSTGGGGWNDYVAPVSLAAGTQGAVRFYTFFGNAISLNAAIGFNTASSPAAGDNIPYGARVVNSGSIEIYYNNGSSYTSTTEAVFEGMAVRIYRKADDHVVIAKDIWGIVTDLHDWGVVSGPLYLDIAAYDAVGRIIGVEAQNLS